MKPMSVTRDLNLGTLVPVMLWLFGITTGGVWWAAQQSADTAEIHRWQIRQDAKIADLEEAQDLLAAQNARMEALLSVIRTEQRNQAELILDELREGSPDDSN